MRNVLRKGSGVLALLVAAKGAWALPLLSDAEGYRAAQLLTLYPDSKDPNKYYFAPNSGNFSKSDDGIPNFGFTYWGLNPADPTNSGAYMTFTMKLAIDQAQKRAIDEFLTEHPGARIAPLAVMSSAVGLNTTNNGQPPLGKLFDEFNFPKTGGRLEDEIGVNSVMSAIGAKVMKASIENPQMLKIDYCYKTQGLGPNFEATITVDFAWVYNYFYAAGRGGGWFFKASASRTVENLIRNGNVNIQIDGGNQADETFVRSVADRIVDRVFKVELEAKPGQDPSSGGWSFSRVSLNSTNRSQYGKETWHYQRRDLVEREFCLPLKLSELTPYKDRVIKNADAQN